MTLQESVAEKISQSGTKVKDIVIDELVNVEINKRTELIIQALPLIDKFEKELAKNNKPDIAEILNAESVVIQQAGYSKSKLEQIKKEKEKLENLKKAIDDCLELNSKDSYSKLENLIKNAGGNKQENSGKDS
jgi:hypothetical protein